MVGPDTARLILVNRFCLQEMLNGVVGEKVGVTADEENYVCRRCARLSRWAGRQTLLSERNAQPP